MSSDTTSFKNLHQVLDSLSTNMTKQHCQDWAKNPRYNDKKGSLKERAFALKSRIKQWDYLTVQSFNPKIDLPKQNYEICTKLW